MLLDRIASELGVDREFVEKICRQASHLYKSFSIKKRKTGYRMIDHPSRELKAIQRWLDFRVLTRFPVHAAATAYMPESSIYKNAKKHVKCRFLLRMDFAGFFPSITSKDVCHFLTDNREELSGLLGFPWKDRYSEEFSSLVCKNGRLTIGAPTSPRLSNLLLMDLDTRLARLCLERGVLYSRYADDLYFSTKYEEVLGKLEEDVYREVEKTICPGSLRMNSKKTYHSSKKGRQSVTGLVLTNDGKVSLGRRKKRRIRSMVFKWEALGDEERRWLCGFLAFVQDVEPDFINRLIVKFGDNLMEEIFCYLSSVEKARVRRKS